MTDSFLSSHPRTALVLGAGGILGCAHAGVIAVLREAKVPIDLVVGASVGSIFGLALAAGVPTERMIRAVREMHVTDMLRFYAGRLRASRRNPIGRMLLEAGEGKTFADLDLPFAVVVTDMETGRPETITTGPVLDAVQASIAIPFVARPAEVDGRLYVDGGLMDTAPVGVARAMGAERVIAVCLGINYTAPAYFRRRPWTRSMLERLGRQRRPLRGRLPDQIRFGCRLYAASFSPPRPAEDADIAIWPDFGGKSPNSITGAVYCLEQGMKAAREALCFTSLTI